MGAFAAPDVGLTARVHNLPLGPDAGRACVFIDGAYRLCLDEADADGRVAARLGDPGLDASWHRLEVSGSTRE